VAKFERENTMRFNTSQESYATLGGLGKEKLGRKTRLREGKETEE